MLPNQILVVFLADKWKTVLLAYNLNSAVDRVEHVITH